MNQKSRKFTSGISVPQNMLICLSNLVPKVYDLIVRFNHENSKTEYFEGKERIVNE